MASGWMHVGQSVLLGWMVAACSNMQWQSAPPPSTSTPNGSEAPPPAAPEPNAAPASTGPVSVSVTLRVTCSESVNVFFGSDPKFGSGRSSRLSGNSLQNESMQPGDVVWLTDESRNGIASASVSASTREISVACNGITAQ